MKTKLQLFILSTAVLGCLFLFSKTSAQTAKGDDVIKNGSVVSFEYTLSDENGKIIESNKGKEAMTYTHGQGQIIPGLEKQLTGMKIGGQKNVNVKPDEAYGPIDPSAFQEIPREKIPPEALKVGTTLVGTNAQGQSVPLRVHEIKERTVVVDLNHPLAGKTLSFDVKILSIKPADTK